MYFSTVYSKHSNHILVSLHQLLAHYHPYKFKHISNWIKIPFEVWLCGSLCVDEPNLSCLIELSVRTPCIFVFKWQLSLPPRAAWTKLDWQELIWLNRNGAGFISRRNWTEMTTSIWINVFSLFWCKCPVCDRFHTSCTAAKWEEWWKGIHAQQAQFGISNDRIL